MYSNRTGSSFQPHPLAATASVDQRGRAFILARDHDPAAVAAKLAPDQIKALLPKAPAADRLLVHEVTNVPSGNSRNVQRLRGETVAMRASLLRGPTDPFGEFRL